MKKFQSLLILSLAPAVLFAGSQQYQVSAPQLETQGDYTTVNFPNAVYSSAPGSPQIPAWPVQLLLPQGTAAADVTVEYSGRVDLPGSYRLPPVQQEYPLSQALNAARTQPDPAVYNLDQYLPEAADLHETTEFLCGHGILLAQAHPVRYNPVTGRLFYYSQFMVHWRTTFADDVRSCREQAAGRVARLVDNPQQLHGYSYSHDRPEGDYDYAIVTDISLQTDFQPLADFKNSLGIRTQIHLIDDILNQFDGQDNAEKLRNFLIAEYEDHGIGYLLLAGDVEFVPWRGLYVNTYGTWDHLPSDMYFACLDGNWNDDGDNYWGEPNEADWYAELSVGRGSVSTSYEASNFVNKQISYQQSPVVEDLENYLMIGENLDDIPTWGGTCKDQIINGSSAHGIVTAGMPDNLTVNTLYDRDYYWSSGQLFDQLGEGVNVTNHLGHCNWNYAMKFYNSDVTLSNFTSDGVNHNFHIGYSQGCIPGAFEETDCIVEKMTNLANGYAAFVANSRYGWYQPGGTGGSSQLFDREFFDALNGEEIYMIGSTNRDSKEDLASWCTSNSGMRWSCYELNVFGDPTLQIWSAAPLEQNLVYQTELVTGMPQMELTLTSDGQPVADALAALVRDGELYGRAFTDENGEATIVFDQVIMPGEYDLMISGPNLLPTPWAVTVIAPDGPYLAYATHSIIDDAFNQNGQAEAGETVDMPLELHNYGSMEATGITAVVTTEDPQVTMLETETAFDTIEPGLDGTSLTPICFSTDPACVDGQQILFTYDVVSNEDEWSGSFLTTIHAPELSAQGFRVNDGDNGQLDPGETSEILLTIHNGGSGLLTGVEAALTLVDDYVDVTQGLCTLDQIEPDGSVDLSFTITASPDTPIGHDVDLTITVNGDLDFSADFEVGLMVGLTVEDFETGDFSRMEWEMSGAADWVIDGNVPQEGNFCARSGSIGDNCQSMMSVSGYVIEESDISFHYKVSSEDNYDYFRFYIDGEMQFQISGELPWMPATYEIPVGHHTFAWRYHKDGGAIEGDDCAWVDYIIFPQFGPAPQPLIELDVTEIEVYVPGGGTLEETLTIGNAGEGELEYTIIFMDDAFSYHHDMEAGEAGWEHAADTGDPWHLTQHDWNSDDHAWYVGEEDSWQYANDLHGWLVSPPFTVGEEAQLSFWHRVDMETVDETFARDAGIIEVSTNDGDNWLQVSPVGGYPYHYNNEDGGPFNNGQPCYSGTTEWEQVQVNLGAFTGHTLLFRWRFGSGASGTGEGWYIDDLAIGSFGTDWISFVPAEGTVDPADETDVVITFDATNYSDEPLSGLIFINSNDPENPELVIPVAVTVGNENVEEQLPLSFFLAQNYPNPFNPVTTINYGLKTDCQVRLVLYNTLGQQVMTLVDAWSQAGQHQVRLDASSLASGLYVYRMTAADFTAIRKLVVVK